MLALLARRHRGSSICPSEAARAVAGDKAWRQLLEPVRRAARRLAHRDLVEILQGGRVVDPSDFRGPIRVRRLGWAEAAPCERCGRSSSGASGDG